MFRLETSGQKLTLLQPIPAPAAKCWAAAHCRPETSFISAVSGNRFTIYQFPVSQNLNSFGRDHYIDFL